MKKLITILCITIISTSIFAANYYVNSLGDDNNNGLSETNAWKTISYSVSSNSPVSYGDTIFIKAGYYTQENIVIEKNGTTTNPIIIQGYYLIPSDNPNINYTYGDTLNSTIMPLINGSNRSTGWGININGANNITIKNIQIQNFEYGVLDHSHSSNQNLTLDNILVSDVGNLTASYSGKAFELYSSNNTINNCFAINACAQGILVYGNNNRIENCKVYCDNNLSVNAAMDYYIVIYNGNNNIVQDCYVERIGNLPHGGHGIGAKGDSQYNNFNNCTAKNFKGEAFYVRHRGARHNTFSNCKSIGITIGATGFIVRDGASYNIFNNCSADNCKRGLMFYDTSEDGGAQFCGKGNHFNNCIITNTELGIDFNDYDQNTNIDSNYFNNCLFYNGITLINVERNNFDNQMNNCIISNYQSLKTELNGFQLDFNFNYCNFYNNAFATPFGTGNISLDPMFTNENSSNFHLTTLSPCIDNGTTLDQPIFDFDGNARPQGNGIDIGPYEFTVINHPPTASNVQILGTPTPCETLSLNYTFSDPDGDAQGGYIVAWSTPALELQRDTIYPPNTFPTPTFTIPPGYEGQQLGAWIRPIDEHGMEGPGVAASNNLLTIGPSISSTDVIEACFSYAWIDGNTYTTDNNTASYTLTAANSCDSIVYLDLTINNIATHSTETTVSCASYTWIDGNTYTSNNNTATYTLTNAAGCDSIISLDLTINPPTYATDNITSCTDYTWMDGNTYTTDNNTANYTLVASNGCDSIINLNLTINPIDLTTTLNGVTIEANENGATYQWLLCGNNMMEITNETSLTYTAIQNGLYAVEITKNGCTDTTNCASVNSVAIEELKDNLVTISPNPTNDVINVNLNELKDVNLTLFSINGKLIYQKKNINTALFQFNVSEEAKGIYILQLNSKEIISQYKIIIE